MRHIRAFFLGALLIVGTATVASAQHSYTELNLHAGTLITDLSSFSDLEDDTDATPMAGIRLARHSDTGWGIGGNFDWIFASEIDAPESIGGGSFDFDLFLYSLEIDYTFPSAGRTNFFVGAGAGGATERLRNIPPLDDDETETDFLLPILAGLKIHNDEFAPTWAFRIDVRDNMIFSDRFAFDEDADADTELEHNWEFSAGISFFFGGTPKEPPPPPDSDNDGVVDSRDQCPNTAPGVRVDSFGCPVPVDSDGDGVIDDRDQCPNTPPGEEVDAVGCPIPEPEPEPVVSCADGRDWYRENATISVDGRNWVKFGSSTTVPMEQLMQIGTYDGVPVYVDSEERAPYTTAYVPLCAAADTYQPYQVEQGVRGTTG